jgi:hypothetical protein
MKNFDTRVYSISDFLEWEKSGLLLLSPDFQRRAVWSEKAKSYLIDTILRGKPLPKIIINQRIEDARNIRVVVDGQQRLRAILGFINGDFKISRAHNKNLAGYIFENLPEDMQKGFLQYELGVDVIFELDYEDILDIFQRINSYTVILNKLEIINAKYLGFFKQYVFEYGRKYVKYFVDGGILTKSQVTRMAEAELSADLFVALVGGIQTNKNNEQYYKKYEDDIGNLEEAAERFDNIMSYVGTIYTPEQIVTTNWSRVQLFYTLFTTIGHFIYGLTGPNPDLRVSINRNSIGKLRVRLDEISSKYDDVVEHIEDENSPIDYKRFIDLSRRRTTDTGARIDRTNFTCEKLMSAFK